ncbi:MAG: hypothetical protein QY318_03130 [Candidatus Dojkabacteria bacterium]|nr:MAG: hypothetical protein QY318_03130 [Candidatus Dojkabacteria bacterium]
MIENLFISKVRIKMLDHFLSNPSEEYHVRGLVRLLDEEINAVRRELQNLERCKLLHSQRRGNKLYYKLTPENIIVADLRALIYKDRADVQKVAAALLTIEGIKAAFLTENYINNSHDAEYDIDLFVLGKVSVDKFTTEMKKLEKELEREFRMTLFTPEDLEFQHKKRDAFLLNVLRKDRIMLIGSEKDLY